MPIKKSLALLIILITIIQVASTIKTYSQEVNSEVNRVIEINENYAKIVDEINISWREVNITQYIPKQYSDTIFIVKAYDENGERSVILEEDEDNIKMVIIGEIKGKIILEVYLIKHLQVLANLYVFQYPLYPILNIMIGECKTTIYYPKETVKVNTIIPLANITKNGRQKVEYYQSPLPQETKIELYTSFEAKITPITVDRINRIVSITQQIYVKDSILIRNLSGGKISKSNGIKLKMPMGTEVKYVSDPLGKLNYFINVTSENLECTVYPRIDIQSGWTYEFTIEYTIPREKYIVEGQQETLNTPINTILETPIKQLNVTIEFPSGTKIIQYTDQPKNVMETKIEYQIHKLIAIETKPSALMVTYIPGSMPIKIPTTIIAYATIIIALAASTYIKYKSTRRETKVRREEYIKAIRDSYMEEKDEYIKLKELIKRYGEGEMDRKQYMEGKSKIKAKIENIKRKLTEITVKIESEQAKEKIKEIEEELGKLDALMSRMEELENKKLSKTIRRIEYQRLKDTNEKTYNRIIRRIEAKINELTEIKI
ncbi:MAG: hypothetical protein QXS19_06565 [Candidatus Methanomethylicia archaeon]